jgi:hypothetical protein
MEGAEVMEPLIANGYSTASVVNICWMAYVVTPLFHIDPYIMNSTVRLAMLIK